MQLYLRYALITLGLLALQTTIIPFTSVANIIPDLLLIWIVYIAITTGQIPAMVFGFAIGLTLDLLSGEFLGLSAFTKTVAGFLSGYFFNENKIEMTLGNYQFLVIVALMSFIHNVLYFVIFTQGSEVGFLIAIFRFGLFSTLYTTGLAFVPFYIYYRKPHLR